MSSTLYESSHTSSYMSPVRPGLAFERTHHSPSKGAASSHSTQPPRPPPSREQQYYLPSRKSSSIVSSVSEDRSSSGNAALWEERRAAYQKTQTQGESARSVVVGAALPKCVLNDLLARRINESAAAPVVALGSATGGLFHKSAPSSQVAPPPLPCSVTQPEVYLEQQSATGFIQKHGLDALDGASSCSSFLSCDASAKKTGKELVATALVDSHPTTRRFAIVPFPGCVSFISSLKKGADTGAAAAGVFPSGIRSAYQLVEPRQRDFKNTSTEAKTGITTTYHPLERNTRSNVAGDARCSCCCPSYSCSCEEFSAGAPSSSASCGGCTCFGCACSCCSSGEDETRDTFASPLSRASCSYSCHLSSSYSSCLESKVSSDPFTDTQSQRQEDASRDPLSKTTRYSEAQSSASTPSTSQVRLFAKSQSLTSGLPRLLWLGCPARSVVSSPHANPKPQGTVQTQEVAHTGCEQGPEEQRQPGQQKKEEEKQHKEEESKERQDVAETSVADAARQEEVPSKFPNPMEAAQTLPEVVQHRPKDLSLNREAAQIHSEDLPFTREPPLAHSETVPLHSQTPQSGAEVGKEPAQQSYTPFENAATAASFSAILLRLERRLDEVPPVVRKVEEKIGPDEPASPPLPRIFAYAEERTRPICRSRATSPTQETPQRIATATSTETTHAITQGSETELTGARIEHLLTASHHHQRLAEDVLQQSLCTLIAEEKHAREGLIESSESRWMLACAGLRLHQRTHHAYQRHDQSREETDMRRVIETDEASTFLKLRVAAEREFLKIEQQRYYHATEAAQKQALIAEEGRRRVELDCVEAGVREIHLRSRLREVLRMPTVRFVQKTESPSTSSLDTGRRGEMDLAVHLRFARAHQEAIRAVRAQQRRV